MLREARFVRPSRAAIGASACVVVVWSFVGWDRRCASSIIAFVYRLICLFICGLKFHRRLYILTTKINVLVALHVDVWRVNETSDVVRASQNNISSL